MYTEKKIEIEESLYLELLEGSIKRNKMRLAELNKERKGLQEKISSSIIELKIFRNNKK